MDIDSLNNLHFFNTNNMVLINYKNNGYKSTCLFIIISSLIDIPLTYSIKRIIMIILYHVGVFVN